MTALTTAERQSRRQAALDSKAQALGYPTWRKLETAILDNQAEVIVTKIYTNISERYGEDEHVDIADYQELNPTGKFEIVGGTIREYFEDGTWETVAE